jgi:hypothetical protein
MSLLLNPLEHPVMLSAPRRPPSAISRAMQLPLAMLLVSLARPRRLVELDSESGDLYSAFCQAIHELRLTTQCYSFRSATTTSNTPGWIEFRDSNAEQYGSFSHLSDATMAEALSQFGPATIDLLHIDNPPADTTLDSTIAAWLPKLSQSGVLVIHNIGHGQIAGLWQTLRSRYANFEIGGESGLGLLAIGNDAPVRLGGLLELDQNSLINLRDLLHQLGQSKASATTADPIRPAAASQAGSSEEAAPLPPDYAAALEKIRSLEITLAEQTTHLDRLRSQLDVMSDREAELRNRFLDAHSQLNERDDALMLVTREQKAIAWLKDELALAKDEIRRMKATRLWQLAEAYRRIFKRKSFEFRIPDSN